MDKKKIIQLVLFFTCIIGAIFLGMLIGKPIPKDKEQEVIHSEGNKNAEEDGDSYILIIDGSETNIGNDLVSAEKGCIMVKDTVITDVLGFAKTINEETKEVTYVLGMNSFTFYPGKTMYVYNDAALESKRECVEEDGVYTINIMTIFWDLDLLVNTSDGRMSVSGYYDSVADFKNAETKSEMSDENIEQKEGTSSDTKEDNKSQDDAKNEDKKKLESAYRKAKQF